MSSSAGSLVLASFCAARRMNFCLFIASSRARIDFWRPTKSGTTMCGKTMMSRSGRSGTRSPAVWGCGSRGSRFSFRKSIRPPFPYAVSAAFWKRMIGCSLLVTTSSEMRTSLMFGCDGMSYITSSMMFSMMARSPRAPDLRLSASRAIAERAPSVKRRCTPSISKSFWYCRVRAFFGSFRMRTSAVSSSSSSVAMTGSRPTNSGISPNLRRSSVCTSCRRSLMLRSSLRRISAPKPIPLTPMRRRMMSSSPTKAPPQTNRMLVVSTCRNSCWGCLRPIYIGAEAHSLDPDAPADDVVEPHEGPPADEQDVGRVDLQELLLGMLAAALGRDAGGRPFDDLEQRLLHALARHVARDRGVVALARDLVDLVDVDDAALALLDVVVRVLEEREDDVLDVLTDVAGLGQAGGVGDRKRHLEEAGERLRQQRLAAAGRPDEQDVRLLKLDVTRHELRVDALVVVVDRNREDLLGALLPDHVLVEDLLDLGRLRHRRGGGESLLLVDLLRDDVVAEVDALVADVDRGAGDQLADFVLALATERADEVAAAIVTVLRHGAPLRLRELARPGHDDLVDESVLDRLLAGQEEVPVGVLLDLLEALPGVLDQDVVHLLAQPDDLARLDVDVGRLALHPAERLVDHDTGVGQREALALGSRREEPRGHAGRLPHAQGRHLGLDVLHGVVDREAGGHRAPRRVDVHVDVLLRVLGLEEEELGHDQVGEVVPDRGTQDHDPVAQEARVDVVGPLAATGLLDDDGNEIGVHGRGRFVAASADCTGFGFHGQRFPPVMTA